MAYVSRSFGAFSTLSLNEAGSAGWFMNNQVRKETPNAGRSGQTDVRLQPPRGSRRVRLLLLRAAFAAYRRGDADTPQGSSQDHGHAGWWACALLHDLRVLL